MKCSPTKMCRSERRMCENQQSVLSSVPWISLLISSEVQWEDSMHRWRGHLCLNKAVPHFQNTALKNAISTKHSSLFVHLSVTSVGRTLLSAFVCLGLLSCNHLSTCMVCLSRLCLYDTFLPVHLVRCSLFFPSVGMLFFPVFKELGDKWTLHSLCIRLSLGSAFLKLMCDLKKIKIGAGHIMVTWVCHLVCVISVTSIS